MAIKAKLHGLFFILVFLSSCRSRSDVERGLDITHQDWLTFKVDAMKEFRAEEPKPWQRVYDETEWKGHLTINGVYSSKNNDIWVRQTYPKYFKSLEYFILNRIGAEPKQNFDKQLERYSQMLARAMRESIDYNMKKVRMGAQMGEFTAAMRKKVDQSMIQVTKSIHAGIVKNRTLLDEFNQCITKTNIMNFIEKNFGYEMKVAHSGLANDYKRLSRQICPLIYDYQHDYNTDDGYRLMATSALNAYTIYFFEQSKEKFGRLNSSQSFTDLFKETNLITWKLKKSFNQ